MLLYIYIDRIIFSIYIFTSLIRLYGVADFDVAVNTITDVDENNVGMHSVSLS